MRGDLPIWAGAAIYAAGRVNFLFDRTQRPRELFRAEGRAEPGSQEVQPYDVILLARHFCVSRTAAIYRLKNLGLIVQAELDALLAQERDGEGLAIERSLGLPAWNADRPSDPELTGNTVGGPERDFRSRFLSLALEAYRRSSISLGKLHELGRLVDTPETEIDQLLDRLLDRLGFLDDEEDDEILLPGD